MTLPIWYLNFIGYLVLVTALLSIVSLAWMAIDWALSRILLYFELWHVIVAAMMRHVREKQERRERLHGTRKV